MKNFREYLIEREVLNESVVSKIAGAVLAIILGLGFVRGAHAIDNSQPNSYREPTANVRTVSDKELQQGQKEIYNQFGLKISTKEMKKVAEIAETEGKEEAKDYIEFSIVMPETKTLKSNEVNRQIEGQPPLLQNKKEMSDAYKNNHYGTLYSNKAKADYVNNMTGSSCYFMCLNYIPQYEFNRRLTADQMAEISKECHSNWQWSDEHKKQYQTVGGFIEHPKETTNPLDSWVNLPNTVANMAYKMLENPKDYKDATASWRKATENSGPIKRVDTIRPGEKLPKTGYDYIIVKLPQVSGRGTHFILCDRNMNLIYDPYSTSTNEISNSLKHFLKTGKYKELYLIKVD